MRELGRNPLHKDARRLRPLLFGQSVAAPGSAGAHNLLSATHPDTVINSVTRGSLIYGNATPAWDELAHPAAVNRVLTTDASDVIWSTHALNIEANSIINQDLSSDSTTAEFDIIRLSPTPAASAVCVNFNGVYQIYSDNTGAGTHNTRLWFNHAADSGEMVFGPRATAFLLYQMRMRTERVQIETSVAPDTTGYVSVDNAGQLVVGGDIASADRKLHVISSGVGILYASRLTSTQTGAALGGVGSEHELYDSAGNAQVASESVTLWADATSGSESPLRRWTTYPAGSAGPGYGGVWNGNDVDATGATMIPNATSDVTVTITGMYVVSESGGGADGGTFNCDNGGSVDLYDDGTDVLTLTVNADGSVTVARSAGAATFDVTIWAVWI